MPTDIVIINHAHDENEPCTSECRTPSGKSVSTLLTDEAVEEILASANAATELSGDGSTVRTIYDHGGGRMYVLRNVDRDLILDTYNRGDSEFYFHARDHVLALCRTVKQLREQLTEAHANVESLSRTIFYGAAATAMRDKCVEKVIDISAKNIERTRSEEVRGAASFKSDVLRALESLTLDELEPEK